MTKIFLGISATAVFEMLKTPFGLLLHPTVIAFHESRGLIYVHDQYADSIVEHLKGVGIPASLLQSPREPPLHRNATYTQYRYRPAALPDEKLSRESKSRDSWLSLFE
jgi:hypothetical protein